MPLMVMGPGQLLIWSSFDMYLHPYSSEKWPIKINTYKYNTHNELAYYKVTIQKNKQRKLKLKIIVGLSRARPTHLPGMTGLLQGQAASQIPQSRPQLPQRLMAAAGRWPHCRPQLRATCCRAPTSRLLPQAGRQLEKRPHVHAKPRGGCGGRLHAQPQTQWGSSQFSGRQGCRPPQGGSDGDQIPGRDNPGGHQFPGLITAG